MTPSRALDFAGDVAIVTGAGSRMDGELVVTSCNLLPCSSGVSLTLYR